MLTKEQQDLLNQIARRDGCYMTEQTPQGLRYLTGMGQEICVDTAEAQPSEIEQLKARIEALEARR